MKVAALIFQALKPRPPQLKFLLIFEKNVKTQVFQGSCERLIMKNWSMFCNYKLLLFSPFCNFSWAFFFNSNKFSTIQTLAEANDRLPPKRKVFLSYCKISYVTVTLDWPVEDFSFSGQRQYKQVSKKNIKFLFRFTDRRVSRRKNITSNKLYLKYEYLN